MLPFGVRAGNLYIGRTPYGSRPVIYITPGTFQGSARAPKGSRPAPLDTVRCPLYLLTKIGEKESRGARPFAGRSPGGPLMKPVGSFTGCLRATGLNKTPGELGAASSTHRRPYGFLKLFRRPRNRKGAGRAPNGIGQNIHIYSPYGAREWFVKALLSVYLYKTYLMDLIVLWGV